MSKRYVTSSKPKLWGGTSTEHSSIVVTPTVYRAPVELPKATADGRKLYRKGGTLATRVITRQTTNI